MLKNEAYLAVLESDDAILDGVGNDETLNINRPSLAQTMSTIPSLRLDSTRPGEIEGDDMVGTGQVQTNTYGDVSRQKKRIA